MNGGLAAAALFLLLFAGCSQAPPDEPAPSDADVEAIADGVETTATRTTGIVRCITVDQAISPLPDVRVRLEPGQRGMLSTSSGGCGFDGLSPGAYFLEASKDGYIAARAPVTVQAGVDDPPVVRLVLQEAPESAGFVVYHRSELRMGSSSIVNGWSLHDARSPIDERVRSFRLNIQGNTHWPMAQWIQSEMVWEPVTSLAENLRQACFLSAETRLTNTTYGGSMLPNVIRPGYVDYRHDTYECQPFAAETDDLPVGLVVEQDVTVVTSVFYGLVPGPNWFFTLDGEHPPP